MIRAIGSSRSSCLSDSLTLSREIAPHALKWFASHALKWFASHALKWFASHALKGQKLLAQGNTLGIKDIYTKTPCKGKSFKDIRKLLPLQGVLLNAFFTQGVTLG